MKTMFVKNFKLEPCAMCGGNSFSDINDNDRYLMGLLTVGCKICGLMQTNPRPNEDQLTSFYTHEYRNFYQSIDSPDDGYVKQFNKKSRLGVAVDYLKRHLPDNKNMSFLDVGCSEGTFFEMFRQSGFQGKLLGVEPNKLFAERAEGFGAEIFSDLKDVHSKVDLITLNHVFEHILHPNKFLEQVSGILNSEGILYIDVPDAECYKTINDLHIAHIYHYTMNTLTKMLEVNGFSIIEIEKHAPDMHPESIRVIAKLGSLNDTKFSARTEFKTWDDISLFSSKYKKLRNILTKLPSLERFLVKLKKRFNRNN